MIALSLSILLATATPMPPEPIRGTFAGFNSYADNQQKQKHKKHRPSKHAPPGKKQHS